MATKKTLQAAKELMRRTDTDTGHSGRRRPVTKLKDWNRNTSKPVKRLRYPVADVDPGTLVLLHRPDGRQLACIVLEHRDWFDDDDGRDSSAKLILPDGQIQWHRHSKLSLIPS